VDAFATVADMEERSRGAITAATHPFLQRELDAASRAIRNACGWHIAPKTTLKFTRVSRMPSIVFLPAMQIASVDAVWLNGYETDLSLVEWDRDSGETNIYARAVEIDYLAGYETVPEDLVVLTLELASGALGTDNILREQGGAVAVTYARTSGSLLRDDFTRLDPYRIQRLP
jgi:hypothetical protein